MLNTIGSFLPTLLGCIGLVALASNTTGPCGTRADRPAATVTEHLRAIANHARAIVATITNRSGLNGDQD
ncbi:hypothetical protein [Streptomyces sp. NPDC056730]|uniref:hypothetical protein n=1 Tax=unclassified Streptomyces TaxID=2593676 RepID=UPI0036533622